MGEIMDWKLLVAVILFVFGLVGFSMYQSTQTATPAPQAPCKDCDVYDVSLDEPLEKEEIAVPTASSVVHEVTTLASDISFNEGDKVVLKLDAVDPDGDKLTYTFSTPFDAQGTWQTQNGDAGTYQSEVTVSDGEYLVKKNLTIQVLQTNVPPIIVELSNSQSTINLLETQVLELSAKATDEDGDKLSYTWIMDNQVQSQEQVLSTITSYDDSGRHTLKLVVSDGKSETVHKWVLIIENKNRAPTLDIPDSMQAEETQIVQLSAKTIDVDGDEVTLSYPSPFDEKGSWQTNFESAGSYEIELTASDGKATTKKTLTLSVKNKNRLPEISGLEPITVYEGQIARAVYKVSDPDKSDSVKVSFTKPLDFEGAWKTEYEDAGDYTTLLSFDDGTEIVKKELRIKVVNVNRPPSIYPIADITVMENELVQVKALAADPDGDEVSITFNAPLASDGSWQTDFDDAGEYTATAIASDGKDSSELNFKIVVNNKNRPPQILGVTN